MQQNTQENITKIHLKPFFNDLLPLYYDMANFKQINLIENIQNSEIVVDKNMLSVVLRNLLDNAIKYTDSEQDIILEVQLIREELLLSIRNHCSEMTDSQKNKIANFLINTKTHPIDGIGIGLMLIKQYSQKMKASLTFNYETPFMVFELRIPKTRLGTI